MVYILPKISKGFTLAELLIALAILGVVATFSIPKILNASQDGKFKAVAKDAIAMVSGAYNRYLLEGKSNANTTLTDLLPYMNYVAIDTSTPVDDWQTGTTWGCDTTVNCLVLHSGAKILFDKAQKFGAATNNNYIEFQIDPDGVYSGSTTGSGKAVDIKIFYNGRVTSCSTSVSGAYTNTTANGYQVDPLCPNATYDPPWFSWN